MNFTTAPATCTPALAAARRGPGFWRLLADDNLSSRAEAFLMVGAALLGAAIPLGLWLANS